MPRRLLFPSSDVVGCWNFARLTRHFLPISGRLEVDESSTVQSVLNIDAAWSNLPALNCMGRGLRIARPIIIVKKNDGTCKYQISSNHNYSSVTNGYIFGCESKSNIAYPTYHFASANSWKDSSGAQDWISGGPTYPWKYPPVSFSADFEALFQHQLVTGLAHDVSFCPTELGSFVHAYIALL